MKNKRVKGWRNVDKLFAENKQVIQKSRIEYNPERNDGKRLKCGYVCLT